MILNYEVPAPLSSRENAKLISAGLIRAAAASKCLSMTEARDMSDSLLDRLGRFLARRLHSANPGYEPYTPSDPETLSRTLQAGDVLLVEGNEKVSAAIKYLTQSTWSHAALYVGNALKPGDAGSEEYPQLVEVNLGEGCVAVPLSKYTRFNTRICRPVGLTPDDRAAVVSYIPAARSCTSGIIHCSPRGISISLPTSRWSSRHLNTALTTRGSSGGTSNCPSPA